MTRKAHITPDGGTGHDMKTLTDVLEDVKRMGHYSVRLFYGEDIGCDDMSVPALERRVLIIGAPVGFLGEMRRAWVGTHQQLLEMDIHATPMDAPNPPNDIWRYEPGVYHWGTYDALTSEENA